LNGSLKRSDSTALPRHGSVARTGDASSGGKAAPEGTQSPPHGVLDELSGTFASARRVVSDFLELLSLETRRAGLALVGMVACGAVAAILVVTAWLGFMAALALWAVSLGIPWVTAVAVISLANLLAAAITTYVCIRMSRDLLFPATRRQLEAKPTRSEER
jgi:uncharacterized membrane protein YqjE